MILCRQAIKEQDAPDHRPSSSMASKRKRQNTVPLRTADPAAEAVAVDTKEQDKCAMCRPTGKKHPRRSSTKSGPAPTVARVDNIQSKKISTKPTPTWMKQFARKSTQNKGTARRPSTITAATARWGSSPRLPLRRCDRDYLRHRRQKNHLERFQRREPPLIQFPPPPPSPPPTGLRQSPRQRQQLHRDLEVRGEVPQRLAEVVTRKKVPNGKT